MIDKATTELLRQLKNFEGTALLIADENTLPQMSSLHFNGQLKIISNRFDVSKSIHQAGYDSLFNDFDFSSFDSDSLDAIFYRVSKEKPVVHHIINQALEKLATNGRLFFFGYKSDGTKTYFDKAKKLFGGPAQLNKNGETYSASVEKSSNSGQALDDKNYNQLRPTLNINHQQILSKPGLFGWNKIDKGSELLIATLPSTLTQLSQTPASLLDLGCGYGYLTLATAHLKLSRRCATDNNAAAIATAKENFKQLKIDADVIADDCGYNINERFDLILCNPPFHQGFAVDGDLTDKFLLETQRHLNKNGTAIFVVNQFVPLEKKANQYQLSCQEITRDNGFKVIRLHRH